MVVRFVVFFRLPQDTTWSVSCYTRAYRSAAQYVADRMRVWPTPPPIYYIIGVQEISAEASFYGTDVD